MIDRELPRIIETDGGRALIFRDKHLYNSRQPEQRAENRARSIQAIESGLYILASPLLWHGVDVLLSSIPKSAHVIAIEAEETLRNLSKTHAPPSLLEFPRLHFLDSSADIRDALELLWKIGVENFRRCELVSLNGGYRLAPRHYTKIKEGIEQEIEGFWKNKMTLIHMAPLWMKNIFLNLSLYHGHLFSHPTSDDSPLLVIGAGPSAEPISKILKNFEIRKKLRIVAVDTALTPLLKQGVTPDIVVVQEAQFYNVYDFISTDPSPSAKAADPPFFWYDLTSNHMVPRLREDPENLPVGSCGFFLPRFFPTSLFDRLEEYGLMKRWVRALGSVGSTAVELALSISGGKIFIAGLDFSFYYGKSHMRGSPIHQLELTGSQRFSPVGSSSYLFPLQSVFPLQERRGSPRRISTGILSGYAETFSETFSSKADRLFVLEGDGLNLGLPVIDGEEFIAQLSHYPAKKNTGGETCPTGGASAKEDGGRERAKLFLENELALLRRLYDAGNRRLSGRDGAPEGEAREDTSRGESLEHLVEQADYTLHHFPDSGYRPPRKMDHSFIKRLLVSTGHYIRIIERAISLHSHLHG